MMLPHYLKLAARYLRRHTGYALINVVGLALGLACCLLILLYVRHETSYDRFYPQSDRMYRVMINEVTPTSDEVYPIGPYPLAAAMAEDFPDVEQVTRLSTQWVAAAMVDESRFDALRIHRADSNFFKVFALPFVHGHPASALQEPSSAVLTASVARRLFGVEDPTGRFFELHTDGASAASYTVTGVVKDQPVNSHLQFDVLTSWHRAGEPRLVRQGWFGFSVYTYLLLQADRRPEELEARLADFYKRHVGPYIEQQRGISLDEHRAAGNLTRLSLLPVSDIHLHSHTVWEIEPGGHSTYVYLFAVIAAFLLLIACVNYMNLATARSAARVREIGMRRVVGAGRTQLVAQLLTESILMTVLALSIALMITAAALPAFSAFTGRELGSDVFGRWGLFVLLGFSLGVGLLAGSYPAFLLSAFRPASFLKGKGLPIGALKMGFRRGLVVFQFAVTIALLIGTFVVRQQMRFVLDKDLGFNKEHVLVMHRTRALGTRLADFKEAILRHPGVLRATMTQSLPGGLHHERYMAPEGADADKQYDVFWVAADHEYAQCLGLEVLIGRTFDPARATDSAAVVVNEALVRVMGLGPSPVGQRIRAFGDPVPILGVVRDFHFQSLREEIHPFAYFLTRGAAEYAAVRVLPNDLHGTLSFLRTTWEQFVPDTPFRYTFLDEALDAQYRSERQTRTLFGLFSTLCIVIACLGLLGLSAFTAERRTKELGIRKVLGAETPGLVLLLTRSFLTLVGVAFVIAAPLAYVAMHRWLQDFVYRVAVSWTFFLWAGLITLGIALVTVGYQAVRAAHANPIDALRHE